MADQTYDVVIVGAGIAGCSAAITASKGGLKTLVLEKSDTPGKMNMTGGRLYSYALEKLLPDFARTAPIQRRVVKERISILTSDAATTLEYYREPPDDGGWATSSCTILRKSFDEWLQEEVRKAGASLLLSQRVDNFIMEGDNVCGVIANGSPYRANVVILADGGTSMLAQKLGMAPKPDTANYATGAKEVIYLGEDVINERFNCAGENGAAWLFLGYPSTGQMGGGFIYTNRDSLSVGMVVGQKDAKESGVSIPKMLEEFKKHPLIRPLLEGGKVVSRGGHIVPEGGYNAIPELAANGVLIVGDAASFCINLGYTVRGMDLAILSGMAAARTVIRAKEADNFSSDYLWSYHDELERENLLPDMKLYKNIPEFMRNERIFTSYPKLVNNFMADIFTVDGKSVPVWRKISRYAHKIGFMNIIRDAWTAIKSF